MGIRNVYKAIIKPIVSFRDKKWEQGLRARLVTDDFSLLTSNCMGGVIYHRLGLKFNSPTIDTLIPDKDFVKFVNHLEDYLSKELKFIESNETYPIAILGDIKVHFVHYHNCEEAKTKWEERKKRVKMDRLFLIMFDVDVDKEDILKFGDVPCRNRICLSEYGHEDIAYVKKLRRGKKDINRRFMDKNFLLRRRFECQFDFVDFINEGFKN